MIKIRQEHIPTTGESVIVASNVCGVLLHLASALTVVRLANWQAGG